MVDVQNGLPFFSAAGHPPAGGGAGAPRAPRAVARRLSRAGRPGRLVDRAPGGPAASTGACQYVAVSRATRASCRPGGARAPRSRWCTTAPTRCVPVGRGKAPTPMIAVVGRLVPHKQVEHAIDAALALRERFPDLRLHVVGSGWWEAELHAYAARARRRRHRRLRGPRRRGAQARGLRAGLAAGAALAQGGVGAGDRRGRHARAPRRWPTGRQAAPASRSRTDARASSSTTRRSSPRRSATCSPTSGAAATWEKEPASPATPSHGSTPSIVRPRGAGGAGRSARGEPGP